MENGKETHQHFPLDSSGSHMKTVFFSLSLCERKDLLKENGGPSSKETKQKPNKNHTMPLNFKNSARELGSAFPLFHSLLLPRGQTQFFPHH